MMMLVMTMMKREKRRAGGGGGGGGGGGEGGRKVEGGICELGMMVVAMESNAQTAMGWVEGRAAMELCMKGGFLVPVPGR